MPTIDEVRRVLTAVQDPQMNQGLVILNMLKDITIDTNHVLVTVELKIPNYPFETELKDRIEKAIKSLPGQPSVEIAFTTKSVRPPAPKESIPGVRHIIAVYACKGGVGKSTVSTNLALALHQKGAQVGLLDADIHGPNIPLMMGIQDNPKGAPGNKLVPLESHGVKLMSLGFLTNVDKPSIWRGPMVHGAIQQLLRDTVWGNLDYLVVDLPPGTGDAPLSIIQAVPVSGVVYVTTPQTVSLVDGVKGMGLFQRFEIPILGLIENMSGFECPHCSSVTNIFSKGGGKKEADRLGIPLLGTLPLDPQVVVGGDTGIPVVKSHPNSNVSKEFLQIAETITTTLAPLPSQNG